MITRRQLLIVVPAGIVGFLIWREASTLAKFLGERRSYAGAALLTVQGSIAVATQAQLGDPTRIGWKGEEIVRIADHVSGPGGGLKFYVDGQAPHATARAHAPSPGIHRITWATVDSLGRERELLSFHAQFV